MGNAKCKAYYTPEQDGLTKSWDGVAWCNPPYGRQVGKWVRKAAHSNEAVPYSLESSDKKSDKKKANKISNGDRVRRMKDEELARFIMCPNDAGLDEIPCEKNDESGCYECCLAWLRRSRHDA